MGNVRKYSKPSSNTSTKVISIRVPNELIVRLDAACANRNSFILEAIRMRLNPQMDPVSAPPLSEYDKGRLANAGKELNDVMLDALLARLKKNKEFMNDLPKADVIRLAQSFLPKLHLDEDALDDTVFSLKACLSKLPEAEDVTDSLNRTRLELAKVRAERDVAESKFRASSNAGKVSELVRQVFESAVGYVTELVARNSLPGLGDGGGLDDRGRAEIARRVRRECEKLEIDIPEDEP